MPHMQDAPLPHKRVFTFWEPRACLTPYLALCRKTWDRILLNYEIIELNYQNLGHYIGEDLFDLSILKRFPLHIQKDAIMVAALKKHGGIFMDMDTLVLRDIAPLFNRLKQTEIIMFNTHLGFVLSRENASLFSPWLVGIQKKLEGFEATKPEDRTKWDYLGNSLLCEAEEEIIGAGPIERFFQNPILKRIRETLSSGLSSPVDHPKGLFIKGRRFLYFRTFYKRYLNMLPRDRYGFIQEALYYRTPRLSDIEKYQKYWFEEAHDSKKAFLRNPYVIGLHNSWTPEWYKRLSEQEVLNCECRLSKTLRYLLNDPPAPHQQPVPAN